MIRVKPRLPVLDWKESLTNKMVFCCPFFSRGGVPMDLIKKKRATAVSSPTWVTTPAGPGGKISGSGGAAIAWDFGSHADWNLQSPYTVMMITVKNGSSSANYDRSMHLNFNSGGGAAQ